MRASLFRIPELGQNTPMSDMKMPKLDQKTKDLFQSVLPVDPRVQTRPMFGSLAGFVNGNMFCGVAGSELFVRLSETDHQTLLATAGAHILEPMVGKPMSRYVVLPTDIAEQAARDWLERGLTWTAALPAKAAKPPKAPK